MKQNKHIMKQNKHIMKNQVSKEVLSFEEFIRKKKIISRSMNNLWWVIPTYVVVVNKFLNFI